MDMCHYACIHTIWYASQMLCIMSCNWFCICCVNCTLEKYVCCYYKNKHFGIRLLGKKDFAAMEVLHQVTLLAKPDDIFQYQDIS
jgi:hypothetical protein